MWIKKCQLLIFQLIYTVVCPSKTHQDKIPILLNRELSTYQVVYAFSFLVVTQGENDNKSAEYWETR